MIEVNNLVKRYGDHTAVDHLSFKIEKGKIYGFLGPNGAGKSTTMNMITGYIASTEGTVKIDGHDILEEPEEAKKCIGYLPEQPPLYFDMTVLEYMKFVADLKKIPKDKKANMIEEVMEMVKISDMRNRLIKNLSKGYRQRVGLAEAVMGYPEVIILDEPTTHLDEENKLMILSLLRNLAKSENKLILFSSHDWRLAKEFSDKIWWIKDKKLISGISEEVILNNPELITPKILEFNQTFHAPEIDAPKLEKEMMFSYLQKNFSQDLRKIKLIFKNDFWELNSEDFYDNCHNLSEIKQSLQTLIKTSNSN